jgi:hypothetical protein
MPELEQSPAGGVTASALRWQERLEWWQDRLWPALATLALLGVLLALRGDAGAEHRMLAWTLLAMYGANAAGENPYPRYGIATLPVFLALAAIGFFGPFLGLRKPTESSGAGGGEPPPAGEPPAA